MYVFDADTYQYVWSDKITFVYSQEQEEAEERYLKMIGDRDTPKRVMKGGD